MTINETKGVVIADFESRITKECNLNAMGAMVDIAKEMEERATKDSDAELDDIRGGHVPKNDERWGMRNGLHGTHYIGESSLDTQEWVDEKGNRNVS